MSLDASVWAWKVPGLSPAEKLVLLCLADFTNHERECWPSQALISERCGVSRETVNRALSALIKRGLVVSTNRVGPKGKQANIYEITMSAGCDEKSHPDVTKCHSNGGSGCDVRSHRDVTRDHIEPLIEPLKKDKPPHPTGDTPLAAKRRATRLAADWTPTPADLRFAAERGWEGKALDDMVDNFRDTWISKSGKDAAKLDWAATWRRWVRTERKPRHTENHREEVDPRVQLTHKLLREMDNNSFLNAPSSQRRDDGEPGSQVVSLFGGNGRLFAADG